MQKLNKVYKYRANLTKEQELQIDEWLETSRWLYNKILAYCIDDYKYAKDNYLTENFGSLRKIELSYPYVNYNLGYLKFKIPPEFYRLGGPVRNRGFENRSTYYHYMWLKDNAPDFIRDKLKSIPSVMSQDVLDRVGKAYDSFFKGGGYPKFKKGKLESITWTQMDSISLNDNILSLGKRYDILKNIKLKLHRQIPIDNTIKNINISKSKTGKYFVNITVEYYQDDIIRPLQKIIAIDRNIKLGEGIRDFGAWYDGMESGKITIPTFVRDREKEYKRVNRQISRCVIGSEEFKKAQRRSQHIWEKISNQKKDFLNWLSTYYIQNYDVIILEDLSIVDMTDKEKSKKKASKKKSKYEENIELTHAKQIRRGFAEVNHGEFQMMLEKKAIQNGNKIIKVDPAYTSMACHSCNYINHNLTLDNRSWECPNCKTMLDRDINAAINIYNIGIKQI